MVAVTPLCIWIRKPQKPDASELSATVTIQPDGSAVPVCHTLAARVVPMMLKSMEYDTFPPFESCPALFTMENTPEMFASPPHV